MYTEFAGWFDLLSPPADYAEEAGFYFRSLVDAARRPPRTLLELGAGAGSNAWHYKHWLEQVTLTDLSAEMLALSQQLNSDCEHLVGDMRSLRLEREFDLVFIHDAVGYLTTTDDLRQAMQTAFVHCRPGGAALFAPDHTRENFVSTTDHGGQDGDGRGLRYLEWTFDPDPADCLYQVDYAYVLHEAGQPTRAAYDQHVCGLFSRADWLRLLGEVGFEACIKPFDHSELPPGTLEVFVAARPG